MDGYMKQKLKRNFLFWGKMGQIYTLIMIAVTYVYVFLDISGDTLNMFMMMSIMGSGILPLTFIQAYFPTVISFGSGRKEAMLGVQWMFFIYMFEFVAATWIACFVFPEQAEFIAHTVYEQFWLMLGMTGMGQINAAIFLLKKSKGRTMGLIVIGCFMFISMVASILVGSRDFMDEILNRTVLQIGVTIGASVLYVISIMMIFKCTQKYEAFSA